jgi:DNA-binding transcriptional LysR family regulator
MNQTQLRHFVYVFELNNLTKAARALGVGQSTISKSIQKLEQQLQLKLFHRHTREMNATDAAKQLYKYARNSLSATEDFVQQAQAIRSGKSGTLTIGCGPLALDLLLKPLVQRLIANKSKVRLRTNTGSFADLKYGLDNHRYDCLLYDIGELQHIVDPSDYQVLPLLQKPVFLVARLSHPIHQQRPTKLEHLFDFPWVLPPVPQRYITQLPPAFQQFLLNSQKPDFMVSDLSQALALAEQNDLITIAVSNNANSEMVDTKMRKIPLPFNIESDIGLWQLRSRYLTPSMDELIELLRAECELK